MYLSTFDFILLLKYDGDGKNTSGSLFTFFLGIFGSLNVKILAVGLSLFVFFVISTSFEGDLEGDLEDDLGVGNCFISVSISMLLLSLKLVVSSISSSLSESTMPPSKMV